MNNATDNDRRGTPSKTEGLAATMVAAGVALNRGRTYEKACVLWNLASIESFMGQRETYLALDLGGLVDNSTTKTAAIQHSTKANKHYCAAAGLVQHISKILSTHSGASISNIDADFSTPTLSNLQQLLLTQGQSCAFDIAKRRTPDMHSVLGKLCYGAHEGYTKVVLGGSSGGNSNFVKSQTLAWKARAEYHKALECWTSRKYGISLCRLRAARSDLQQALQVAGSGTSASAASTWFAISSSTEREWQLLSSSVEEQLTQYGNDNDTVYKQPVPAYGELSAMEKLKGLFMAKVPPLAPWTKDVALCPTLFDPSGNSSISNKAPPPQAQRQAQPPRQSSFRMPAIPPAPSPSNNNNPRPMGMPSPLESPMPIPQARPSAMSPRAGPPQSQSQPPRSPAQSPQQNAQQQHNDVPKAMKRFSKEVMHVFDSCEGAAANADLTKIRAWLERHPSKELLSRLAAFQVQQTKQNQHEQQQQEQEQQKSVAEAANENHSNQNNRGLLPLQTWNSVQKIQEQSTLDELSMRLWQLRDASEDARAFCQQIDGALKENVEMDRLFREQHDNLYYGQKASEAQQNQQAEYDHYLRLLEDAQQGDTALLEVLDSMDTQSKYKLLRMNRHDIEHLVAPSPRDQERLKELLQQDETMRKLELEQQQQQSSNKSSAASAAVSNLHPKLVKLALTLNVQPLKERCAELLKSLAVQEELFGQLHVFGQDKYLHQLQDRLKGCASSSSASSSASPLPRKQVHPLDQQLGIGIGADSNAVGNNNKSVHETVEAECEALRSLEKRVCRSFQEQSQLFRDVLQHYKLFGKAEQTLAMLRQASHKLLKQQQQEKEAKLQNDNSSNKSSAKTHLNTATKDPAMIRYNNIVQSIDDAVTELTEKITQVKDGEHFYKNMIPRLQELLQTIQDLSTTLAIERCEYEEQVGSHQHSTEIQTQMQKDHEAAAQLARELDEADQRRQEEDARMATELARNLTLEDEGEKEHSHNGGGGVDMSHAHAVLDPHQPPRPPDVVDAPDLITTCSTLGDPLLQAAAQAGHGSANVNSTTAFLNDNPQYGTRPAHMQHTDRLISDITMPMALQNTPNAAHSSSSHLMVHNSQIDPNQANPNYNPHGHGHGNLNPNRQNSFAGLARSNSYDLDTITSDDRQIAEAAAMAEASQLEQEMRNSQQFHSSLSRSQLLQPPSEVQRKVSFAGTQPGVYQMSNEDAPAVRVNDTLVAELVNMGFDATKALEALERHENRMEEALNDLLSS